MRRVTFQVLEGSLLFLVIIWCCIEFIFAQLLQLPNKEPLSLSSRIAEGASADKKKPFSRPFSKGRLEPSGASVRMASPVPNESGALLRQNHELRQRLQDESSSYRRRLDTYKQAQSNQSALVSRLQAKVLQYKQRCAELENHMNETVAICPQNDILSKTLPATSTPLPPSLMCSKSTGMLSSSAAPMSLPPVCTTIDSSTSTQKQYCSDESDESFERKRAEEERKLWVFFVRQFITKFSVINFISYSCDQLLAQNTQLRHQLEESHRTNESLTNDLQKLTNDWESLRDEMLAKEDEWKMEEEVSKFNNNFFTRSSGSEEINCHKCRNKILSWVHNCQAQLRERGPIITSWYWT